MRSKLLLLVSFSALALALTGCGDRRTAMGPEETNVLGIYKNQQENYSPASPATFAIQTDELVTRRNYSGDKTTLLWGLVTIQDY